MPISEEQKKELKALGFSNLTKACQASGLSVNVVYDRWIRCGWSLERSLATPRKQRHSETRVARAEREIEEERTGQRECLRCKRTRPLSEYRRFKSGRWDRDCVECRYYYNLQQNYGITREQYEEFWSKQGGKCFGCKETLNLVVGDRKNQVHVEHDHSTGDIRGLACRSCNWVLGSFQDDPERIERAAAWVFRTCPIEPLYWHNAVKSISSGSTRGYTLWENHGLTPDDFELMLGQQSGVCGICKQKPRTRKGWAVDHCEVRRQEAREADHPSELQPDATRGWRAEKKTWTKRVSVRGVLCDECNKGLGHAKDSPETLLRLAGIMRGRQR